MDAEIERLRRRERELEACIARLEAERGDGLRRPDRGERTSVASTDLLFTAAEKTCMAQIITDPNLSDKLIVSASWAFQNLCGYDAAELIGRTCPFLRSSGTDPADVAKVRDANFNDQCIRIVMHSDAGPAGSREVPTAHKFVA